jgi:hypothetical protein
MKPIGMQQANKHKVMEHNLMGLTTLQSQEFLYGKHGSLVPERPKGAH